MKLKAAENMLINSDNTCVFYNGKETLTSKERGVKPLLEFLSSGRDFKDFSVADKVVGKAAAYLYVLLGIKEIYADVISEQALNVLKEYNIRVQYGKCVPMIINRAGTGFCPMESAVLDTDDPNEALKRIKEKISAM